MTGLPKDQLLQMETTNRSLLYELHMIWDELGESDTARDKILLELEQECLEVYRRKVDQANRCRAQLRQAIAEAKAELAAICSVMGEPPVHVKQKAGGLREELNAILLFLEEMRKKKVERWNQFLDIIEQIKKIAYEIRPAGSVPFKAHVDQSDISLRKLEDLTRELQCLQKEKSDRLKQVMDYCNTLHSLCGVLGIDFKQTIHEIHPSLDGVEESNNISNATIERFASAVEALRDTKIQRMQKLQDLTSTMLELWNLMDTPVEEQQLFQNITCKIAASEHEITEDNSLSIDFLSYVEIEVLRLEQLKTSKITELVLKKKIELEEHRRRAHLVDEEGYVAEFSMEAIEAGAIDPSLLLEQIDTHIAIVKEEAFSRKDILERVEKWLNACEEEAWLEEYNKGENHYNTRRGAHLMLKKAEKARILVNKIPGMVDTLTSRIAVWEKKRDMECTYDGVPLRSMLEEYTIVRQEKEHERKRQRGQKKLQDQLKAEQEALYGSKPSSSKPQNSNKMPRSSVGVSNRRLSLGGATTQPPKSEMLHPKSRTAKKPEDVGTLSPGSRGIDIVELPINKSSFNASALREMDTPRKPFAEVMPGNTVPSTPARPTSSGTELENKTPKPFATRTPKRPMTVSAPMQVATTPALTTTAAAPVCLAYEKSDPRLPEEFEYSFEERRLTVYLASQVA